MTREALLRATVTALQSHSLAPDSAGAGLGWTAKSAFLVHDAGTVLATAEHTPRTPYTKTYNGLAICAYCEDCNDGEWSSDWCGVLLISTIREAVVFYSTAVGSSAGSIQARQYLGLTWYVSHHCQNASCGGATHMDCSWPNFDFSGSRVFIINGRGCTDEAFFRIMQAAGVQAKPKRLDRPVLMAGRV